MASAHQTFARHPNNFRGVLTCGEFTPLTLEGVEVSVTSLNLTARVTIRCEFKNNTGRAQDVFAAFTQVASWDLCSMRCEGGKHFSASNVAKVETHEQLQYANDMFVPVVATQVIPWQVLNLETVVIAATFLAPMTLSASQSELSLVIPKELFPLRVEPLDTRAEFSSFFSIPVPSRLPKAVFIGAKGSVSGVVDKPPTISGCRSTAKSQGNVGADKKTYTLRFEDTEKSLSVPDDLVVTIPVVVDAKESLIVAVSRETAALVDNANKFAIETTFAPAVLASASGAENSEVVMLVDGTESMRPYAAAVRRALRLAVAGLPAGSFFNVVKFGAKTGPEWLFPKGSEELNETTRSTVLHGYLPNLEFDLPGCSLLSAVRAVYETPFITGYVRNVVLITDGGDEIWGPRMVEICRANTHSTRLSVVALGPNALVNQLELTARFSNGHFSHLANPLAGKDTVASAVVATLSAVVVPTLTHVSLRFASSDGSDVVPPIRQCASLLPVVPTGGRLVTYGIADDSLKDFTAILSGLIGGAHCEFKYACSNVRDVTASHQADDALTVSLAHLAAAHARIRGLLDFHVRSTLTSDEQQEVASLSSNFFLPSPFTRFVVRSDEGKIGPGGAYGGYIPSKLSYKVPLKPTVDVSGCAINADRAQREQIAKDRAITEGLSNTEYCSAIIDKLVSLVCAVETDTEQLLDSQKEDGSFPKSSRFFAAVGISDEMVSARKPTWADDETWATSLGIVAAEKLEGSAAQLALRKARAFITARNAAETVNAARRTLM
jgi:hypothetical protein